MLSPFSLSPVLPLISSSNDSVFITPTISPISFINTSSNQIIPPAIIKTTLDDDKIITNLPFGLTSTLNVSDIYVPTINLNVGSYFDIDSVGDVCNIQNIKDVIVKKFYYRFFDDWIYNKDDARHLLNFIKIEKNNGNVKLIDKLDNIDDTSKNTSDEIEKKIDYIADNFLSKGDVYVILNHFAKKTGIGWCKLNDHAYLVREVIIKNVSKRIKKLIGA